MRKVRLSPSSLLRGFKISIDSEKMNDSRQQLELSEPDLVTADVQSHHPPQLSCCAVTRKVCQQTNTMSKICLKQAVDDNQENQKR